MMLVRLIVTASYFFASSRLVPPARTRVLSLSWASSLALKMFFISSPPFFTSVGCYAFTFNQRKSSTKPITWMHLFLDERLDHYCGGGNAAGTIDSCGT